ncbi:MAG: hypothetical protein AB8B58_19575 [Roseobacter sp.]
MSDRWAITKLQNHDLELAILPGIGGRLWDVSYQGRSLLFQNPDLVGLDVDASDLSALPTKSPQFGFPLWGGEKTWIAPDTQWANAAPFPVLDSGAYQITAQQSDLVELVSAVCPQTNLSVTRRIVLTSETTWTIEHAVTNHGPAPRSTGIWSVMMIDTPARIGVAMDTPEFYSVFGTAGTLVARRTGCVVADCAEQREFKVGLPNQTGKTLITFGDDGPAMMCSVPKPSPNDRFAHQHPIEVFNSGDYPYCEAEWHAPLTEISPGKTQGFQQHFRMWSPDILATADATIAEYKELLSCMS